jgi:quercetin dioxygenase-like cupin family protein
MAEKVTSEEMRGRIVRFGDYTEQKAIPLMFIDSLLPGHHRLNYAVIGDTASENPDYEVMIKHPHNFQIGMFKAMPNGNGPAWHLHTYIEVFLPLEGKWRFYWSQDPEKGADGDVILEKWDLISLPPNVWRRFENISDQPAWCFAVLEQHEVFAGKDPQWPPTVVKKAKEYGFESDDNGRMIKPPNYDELNAELLAKMFNA